MLGLELLPPESQQAVLWRIDCGRLVNHGGDVGKTAHTGSPELAFYEAKTPVRGELRVDDDEEGESDLLV